MTTSTEKPHDYTKFPFFDTVPHLIYMSDPEGHINYVNEAFIKFSKKAEDDLGEEEGEGWLRNVHPDDIPRTLRLWGHSLETGEPYENIYRLLNAQGEYQWFLTRANRTDLFGKEYAWVGTCTDISKQMDLTNQLKLLTSDLEDQKNLLSSIQNQLPVAVLHCDPKGAVLSTNHMMNVIWRKELPTINAIDDYSILIAYHSDGRRYEPHEFPMARCIMYGEEVHNEIIEILRGDGTQGLISMSASMVVDIEGNPIACIAVCEDIFDKVSLEREKIEALNAAQAAMESNRLKSAFLANMSHDIRTPINGIIGCTQLLNDTTMNDNQKEYVGIIADCGNILVSLINDILDLSKIEAGKMELEIQPMSLNDMLKALLNMGTISLKATGKTLDIRLNKRGLPAWVQGDRRRIERILQNLLSNAIKFSKDGGHIYIDAFCTYMSSDKVVFNVSVRDEGIGIAEEVQPRLFSAFTQSDISTTRKFGGTGLGLSICKQLTELMNGKIWVRSRLGQGSTFSVSLPMNIATDVATTDEENGKRTAPKDTKFRNKVSLLMAEDNKVNGVLAKRILSAEGYTQVDWAKDGVEVIDMFIQKTYDLVLMDCQMPIMDGFEASRKIRNLGYKVPIIAFTASVMKEERDKCIACGMNDIVLKPFDKEELLAKIDNFVLKK